METYQSVLDMQTTWLREEAYAKAISLRAWRLTFHYPSVVSPALT